MRGERKMINNQDKDLDETGSRTTSEDESEGFEVTNQGQNLGGGKSERTIDVGETDDGNDFSKTDQSITQAAPGQTVTNTNQGGSNA
jgi:hypothetical protein